MNYVQRAVVVILAGWLALGAGAPTATNPTNPAMDAILQGLASPEFARREVAQKALSMIPTDQFDMLSQLAAKQDDAEVKARLRTRLDQMAGEIARHQPEKPLRVQGHITGRLVDETGKPIAGARAQAYLAAWGSTLWPVAQWALTDAQGSFDIPVPFLAVNYHVFMEMPAWGTSNGKDILAEKNTPAGDFVMKRGATKTMQGLLVDNAGKPVANQKIEIVGEYGSGSALTDAQGRFLIDGLPSNPGQPVAIVHAGNQTTALEIIRTDDCKLILVEAGTLSGKVLGDQGQPLAGALVTARPWFSSGVRLQARTGEDGAYKLTDVPPGDWLVTAETMAFSHRSQVADMLKNRIVLKAGMTATANIQMERMGIVYGQVLDQAGRAVADAVVGTKTNFQANYTEQIKLVQTDAQGRFLIATGVTAQTNRPVENQLLVFSPQEGLATVPLRTLIADEVLELSVKMPGSVRVAGRVVDPAGKPVPGIACEANTATSASPRTDAQGRFDLGRISRSESGSTVLKLRAARPVGNPQMIVNQTLVIGDVKPEFPDRAHAPTFYAHQNITLPATGDAGDLKVTLQPAQLLEFTGIVRDAKGQPVAGAEVYLLTGDAQSATWLESARPKLIGGGGGWAIRSVTLYRTKTGPDGLYTLWSVREDADSAKVAGAQYDFTRFAVGVYAGGLVKLAEKVEVPAAGKVEVNVEVKEELKEEKGMP